MGTRTISDLHVNAMLTGMSISYAYDQTLFIASQVFPPHTVTKRTDYWPTWGRENYLLDNVQRVPGTLAAERGQSLGKTLYTCKEYAFRDKVLWDEINEADPAVDPKGASTVYVTERILLYLEKVVADLLFTSSNYHANLINNLSGTSKWSDVTSGVSDPLTDAKNMRMGVAEFLGGRTPNTLVIGEQAYQTARVHPLVKEMSKYTQKGPVPDDMMPSVFEVEKILRGKVTYLTNKEAATETSAYVWTDSAVFCYVPPVVNKLMIATGVMFRLRDFQIREYDDEAIKATYVEGDIVCAPTLTGLDASSKVISGGIITDCV